MDLKQLKALIAVVEADFNVSHAATNLFVVQSAISQQISRLEEELATRIFVRKGKRLTGLTSAGKEILKRAYRTMNCANSIIEIGRDFSDEQGGMLRVGATHTQAKYILPPVIKSFRKQFEEVEVQIHQGNPRQLVAMASSGMVDFSICTEALGSHPDLVSEAAYSWNRMLIAPKGHEIFSEPGIDLGVLSRYPIVTYVEGFTGREVFNNTFRESGLEPRVILSAADTDVIKTYVREGMGVGVIAHMAYVPEKDQDLHIEELSHLFPEEITRIAWQRDKYLRQHQRYFIDIFSESVTG